MNKEMFLNLLIQSLNGEVSPQIIEQNVKYYDQYIGKHSKIEEEKILSELGDPRLIAKTIIEAERVAKQKSIYTDDQTGKQRYQQDYNEWHEEQKFERRNYRRKKFFFYSNNNWYHKIKLALILLIVVFVLIIISSILIRLLFIFFPIIILLLCIMFLFRRR